MLRKRCLQARLLPSRSASDGHPNQVASTIVSPAMRNQMHGIPPCSTRQTLCPIGPSVMQVDATVFLRFDIALFSTFSMLANLRHFFDFFDFFYFFNFSTLRPQSLIPYLLLNRPSLVACFAPSDRPMPLFTSIWHRRCPKHRCRQILTSEKDILAS